MDALDPPHGLAVPPSAALIQRSPASSPHPPPPPPPQPRQQPAQSARLHSSSIASPMPGPLPSDAMRPLHYASRTASPRSSVRTPRPMTPQVGPATEGEGAQILGSAMGPRSPDSNRPLNVTDALSYLDAVKMQFQDKPDVYNHFLDIMKDFKSQVIDTPGVIERVSMLFHGNPYLIQGFNTFLPPGYRIELSTDPRNMDTITVTTPMGIMTQNISAYGAPVRIPRDALVPGSSAVPSFLQQPPLALPPPPVLPVGIGNGSRPATPSRMHALAADYNYTSSVMFPSPMAGSQTTAAASFLGNLANRTSEGIPTGEFNHAIQFLNKIKVRFEADPETYKQFLEILHAYQKEHKHLEDSQVYAQVQMLFKNAPDLMEEFRDFLPEALAPATQSVGLVGILPHPTGGPGAWSQGEASTSTGDKGRTPTRRRKRAPEKEVPGAQKTVGGRTVKRPKVNQKPEPQSPRYSGYPPPPSPPLVYAPQNQAVAVLQHPQAGVVPHPAQITATLNMNGAQNTTQDELMFFDRAKKALENGGTYEEFLKLLNLFARDVIDAKTLIDRAEIFLGEGELMTQFKELMGWDDRLGNIEYGPPGSIRTGPPDPFAPRLPDDGQGPSYRRLPESEVRLACSGRRELERSVLNDEWVSNPTWASEESGFVAHKKNTFEDLLFRSEEERHEFQVHLEGLARTILVLEGLDARIDEMSAEERSQFKLKPGLGGSCPAIYERTIRRIYGRDGATEVLKALQECPAVAVPVVLKRLKQKDEEWRRAQREWNKTWREIDSKNFYKALDHQGIMFKANDKKNITAKFFVQDIASIKDSQEKVREAEEGLPWAKGSLGYQLDYNFADAGVLQDSLKLIFSFLDHSMSQYSPAERRSIERFLHSFVPTLFMFSPQDFNSACGPLQPGHEDDVADDLADGDGADDSTKSGRDRSGKRQTSGGQSLGVSPGDLRKRLLKTAQDRSPRNRPQPLFSRSAALSRSASPVPSDGQPPAAKAKGSRLNKELDMNNEDLNTDDIWIREAVIDSTIAVGDTRIMRRSFFANTTFYTLLRLLQLLYSRLLICKEIGARLAAEKHASLLANPVAVQLGLDEPNGPPAILAQALEAVGEVRAGEEPNVLYLYMLDACEKVFDSELDQATFEEHMRWFFGTKAYHVFTVDRVITAVVKQVQTIMADNKCQELWYLLQRSRGENSLTLHDTIRYRREAERHVGSDDNLYRIDWDGQSKRLLVQLVGATDPSVEQERTARGRWKEYVATYVMEYPTEWMPARRTSEMPLFLKRCVMEATEKGEAVERAGMLRVVVRTGTYKLLYEAGGEDVVWRRRGAEAEAALRRRAAVRGDERQRWLGRQGWGPVGA